MTPSNAMDVPIASAVVLPDPEFLPATVSSPTGTKRRQSSISEHDAKRARLNGDASPTDRRDSMSKANVSAPTSRERGRERRLFGSVLGALSQHSTTAGQRRRSEIEKRQQAQRKLADEESEQRKAERVAARKAQRWREQRHYEKLSMQIRHDNLVAMAHFLRTTAEPPLLYKPWETTPEEDNRIRDQIAEAEDTIRRELEEYEQRQQEDVERERHDRNADSSNSGKAVYARSHSNTGTANEGSTDGRDALSTNPEQQGDLAKDHVNKETSREHSVQDAHHSEAIDHESMPDDLNKEAMDEIGGEVVDAGEDMVIY